MSFQMSLFGQTALDPLLEANNLKEYFSRNLGIKLRNNQQKNINEAVEDPYAFYKKREIASEAYLDKFIIPNFEKRVKAYLAIGMTNTDAIGRANNMAMKEWDEFDEIEEIKTPGGHERVYGRASLTDNLRNANFSLLEARNTYKNHPDRKKIKNK